MKTIMYLVELFARVSDGPKERFALGRELQNWRANDRAGFDAFLSECQPS